RLGDELPAEAMPEHGNIRLPRAVYQREDFAYPLEIVVHAHRPAHERQTGKISGLRGYRLTRIHLDQAPRDPVRVEECGKIPRPFGGRVTEYGDGLHVPGSSLVTRIVAVLVFLLPVAAWAADVSVVGLFSDTKAVVVIDGGAPRVLTAGQAP